MARFEQPHQTEFCNWFKRTYPDLIECLDGSAVSDVGERRGAILRSTGVLKGRPDVFISVARKPHHGLYIEFKCPAHWSKGKLQPKGSLSAQQKIVIPKLRAQGYRVEVAHTCEEAKQIWTHYLAQPNDW